MFSTVRVKTRVFGPCSTSSKFLDSHLIKYQHLNLERIYLIKDWKDYFNQLKYVHTCNTYIAAFFLLMFSFKCRHHVHIVIINI